MPTIAIVGAGPGLGMSIARVFGARGFSVALVSRTQSRLDDLSAALASEGIQAQGFAADIMDRDALTAALAAAEDALGPVDVLEFSPAPHSPVPGVEIAGALDVTPENLAPQLAFYVDAAIAAVRAVLPGMRVRGQGTLLFTTGASSVHPMQQMGNIGIATAGLRNWVLNLHDALTGDGVHVAHIAINTWIDSGPQEASSATIAQLYWQAHEDHGQAEHYYSPAVAAS